MLIEELELKGLLTKELIKEDIIGGLGSLVLVFSWFCRLDFCYKERIVLIKGAGGRKYIYRPTNLIYSGQNLKSQDLERHLGRHKNNYSGTSRSK